MNKLLEIQDLKVEIPIGSNTLKAVRGLSFDLRAGETLCIVGESGCGKSLTALAIMDLLPKIACRSSNKLSLSGNELSGLSERKMSSIRGNQMSMIFQEPMTSLNPEL